MKKILFMLMAGLIIAGCSCSKKNPEKQEIAKIVVENVISTDREAMSLKGYDYKWFETGILFKDYLDEENDGTIEEIVNVFQTIGKDSSSGFDPEVFKFQHFSDGTLNCDSIRGFWIEDMPLNDEEIKVTFDSAFVLINQVNLPKPHSRYCTLRKPIGPKPCNAQWVFGNMNSQLWLDAADGTIRTSNPAFPEGFKYAFSW